MKANKNSPATIRLEAHQREISLTQIAKALAAPLLREIPITPGMGTIAAWTRTSDFRDAVMAGLTVLPPQNEAERVHIRQVLKADLELRRQRLAKCEEGTIAAALALLEVRRIDDTDQRLQSDLPNAPVHPKDMCEYARIMVNARIRKMLDDDVAAGRLTASCVNDKRTVDLDSLVKWAVFRRVSVEQDALPGCQSFVQAAYLRLHQQWSNATQTTEMPTPQAPEKPSKKLGWDEHRLRGLWKESLEPGMTHEKLAMQHGVSRPFITQMLKKAKAEFGPRGCRQTNSFDWGGAKT
jgi:hypothetical protein